MEDIIIFNHIPRTGGTTLRVILNRVYGESRVFFINSRDIPASLFEYNKLSQEEQAHYKVISGHGALHFHPRQGKTFMITILREPISLFLSQYHYLRKSPNSNFLEDISALPSFEDYIDYAAEHGQDNMMVRCMDPENLQFTMDGALPPIMEEQGETMLRRAIAGMHEHDMIMGLENFDQDIFRLSLSLGWKKIPVYRPLNKGNYAESIHALSPEVAERLKRLLRFDIEFYNVFLEDFKSNAQGSTGNVRYLALMARQKLIRMITK